MTSAAEASGYTPATERNVLLVFSDSLGFYGPTGGLPVDEPRLWPNLVAADLGLCAEIVARVGWTSRDVWWALTQDPRVWALIPRVRAVVLAVGGMDSMPSPLPTALREQLRYLRPEGLRRRVRDAYLWAQPRLAPLGWPQALPPHVTVEYLERCRVALEAVRPDAPIIGVTPSSHHSHLYGFAHPRRERTAAVVERWANEHGVPLARHFELSHPHLVAGAGNPDGIHWSFDVHRVVADETITVVREALQEVTP